MSRKLTIISIGELLWDVFENSEQLGGAPFNFAAHARRLGHEVVFLSAVGDDRRGRLALERASELGLSTEFIRCVPGVATGVVTVELDPEGQPAFTIHRPAAYDLLQLKDGDFERISSLQPDWLYFGTLHQMDPRVRDATRRLMDSNAGARCFYDINLRRDSYTPPLVEDLMRRARVVKLNEEEAAAVDRMFGRQHGSIEEFSRHWSARYGWEAIAVTRGARGCAVLVDGGYAEVPGYPVKVTDTVGSGDAFAAAFVHGLGQGWSPEEIGDFGNRLGALVASRAGAVPPWSAEECRNLSRSPGHGNSLP